MKSNVRARAVRAGTIAVALGALAAVLATSAARAELIEREYHERFPATAETRLELSHGDGDVEVRASDGDEVVIDVEYRTEAKGLGVGDSRRFEVRFEQNGNVIRVREENDFSMRFGIRIMNRLVYRYTIKAPPTVTLSFEGDDGDVTIERWRADIACTTDDGRIALTDIAADLTHVTTGDGDVSIDGLSGELRVSSDDGEIRIAHAECDRIGLSAHDGNVRVDESRGEFEVLTDDGHVRFDAVAASACRIRTEDGDLDLELADAGPIDWDLRTDDGDVRIRVPGELNARFTLESEDGGIDVDLPGADDVHEDAHGVAGRLGAGDGRIRVATESGHIEIRERP